MLQLHFKVDSKMFSSKIGDKIEQKKAFFFLQFIPTH